MSKITRSGRHSGGPRHDSAEPVGALNRGPGCDANSAEPSTSFSAREAAVLACRAAWAEMLPALVAKHACSERPGDGTLVPPMRGCDAACPQAPASAAAVWAGRPLMRRLRIRRNRRTRARSPTTKVASTGARRTNFPVSCRHSRTPIIRHGRPAKDEADLSSLCGAHEARQAIVWLDHRLPAILLFQCIDCGHPLRRAGLKPRPFVPRITCNGAAQVLHWNQDQQYSQYAAHAGPSFDGTDCDAKACGQSCDPNIDNAERPIALMLNQLAVEP